MSELLVESDGRMSGLRITSVRHTSDVSFDIAYIAEYAYWFMPAHEDADEHGYVEKTDNHGFAGYTAGHVGLCREAVELLTRWQNDQTPLEFEASLEDQSNIFRDERGNRLRLQLDTAALDRP